MISCAGCQKETISHRFRYQTCSDCGQRVYLLDDQSYMIPIFDANQTPALTSWSGFGPNLLHELDRNPPKGYLQTRIYVVLRITETNYKSGEEQRENLWENMNYKLAKYGLKVVPFDPKWKDIKKLQKSDFLSSPCFIQYLNVQQPEISMTNKLLKQIEKFPSKMQINSDWMKKQLIRMYPDQTLSEHQNEAITHAIENPGSLTSIVIPTGSGKTRIAQSLVVSLRNGHGKQNRQEGPIIVLYPTISLMDDQKREWQEKLNLALSRAGLDELNVRVLHSNEDEDERDSVRVDLLAGDIDILLCSPEQLVPSKKNISLIEIAMRLNGNCKGKPFSSLIVDEVHIAFDWGDSIREAFLLLPQMENMLRRINPQLRTMLMTATLTPREENELIFNQMKRTVDSVKKIRNAEVRPDLAFTVIDDGKKELTEIAGEVYTEFVNHNKWKNHPYNSKSPMLMYTFKPRDCEKIAIHLKNRIGRRRIETYTGRTVGTQRKKKLERFQANEISLMVATSAFGMGVNKSDVWMISYIGMPATLRELYQAFGRAARGSGWNNNQEVKKNGNCIARIVRRPRRGYAPTFGPSKALERLIPMILMGERTSNGYVLLSLNPEHQIYWNPYDESDSRTNAVDAENKHKIILEKKGVKISRIPAEIDAWWVKRWNAKIQKRIQEEYNKRRKATIYLEMAGALKTHGFFPANPLISEKYGSLKEMLESGGIDQVVQAYSEIGWESGTKYNTQSKEHIMVAEIQESIEGISELYEAMEKGIQTPEKWAKDNQNELSEFLKRKNECIRIRFLPVVGGNREDPETKSCEDLFQQQQHYPLGKEKDPVMPCSVCRKKIWPNADPLFVPNSNLKFTGKQPHTVWLEQQGLEYLSGRLRIDSELLEDSLSGEIKQLPFEGFMCGFTFSDNDFRPNLHNDLIREKWYELCQRQGITSDQIQLGIDIIYGCDGQKYSGEESFAILIQLMAQKMVHGIDCSSLPQDQFPCGGLLYILDKKLVCRLVKTQKDAIDAFKAISSKSFDEEDNVGDRFIGRFRPDIHGDQINRKWD